MAGVYDVRSAVADALKFTDSATGSVLMTIELNGEAANLLNNLNRDLDRDRGRVIAEALSLLFVGVTIQKEGMQMVVVDQSGKIQTVLDLIPKQ